MSVVAMIWYITPNQRDRRILWGTGGIIIAWAFIAFWVSAFECHSPHVWNLYNGRCINRTAFWNFFEIVNLLTDVLLIIIPGMIVTRVRTRALRKMWIMFFFALRILPIAGIIAKLVFWNRFQFRPDIDITLSIWPVIITMQIIQGLEIFATCCLNLPPFLEGLQSGFMHADDLRRRGQSVDDTYLYSNKKDSHINTTSGRSRAHGVTRIPQIPHISNNQHRVSIKGGKEGARSDCGSQHSRSQIIRETRTFAVDHGPTARVPSNRSDEESLFMAL